MSRAQSPTPSPWRGLLVLFFLSGLTGLVYESIWSRSIRLLLGSAATAQMLVLALFMGGLSVGALVIGRRMERVTRPIVVYGAIEGVIGAYALLFPYLQSLATRLCYDVVFPALGGGPGVTAVKWGVSALLVFPPCVLLGMTFPLMSVGILRRAPGRSGEILSLLYFTNSAGAALGALLSGFVLIPRFGLPGALMAAAAVNLAIMLVAVRDKRSATPLGRGAVAAAASSNAKGTGPGSEGVGRSGSVAAAGVPGGLLTLLLVVAFGTGLSSFMYEIGWMRLLSMVLGSATRSFEVMLSAFVLGLALGGLWVRKRMDRFRHPERVLATVQLIMGVAAIATLPLYEVAAGAMSWLLEDAARTPELWLRFNLLRYLLCLMIMLPATFCAGMTLPLVTHLLLRRGASEGIVGKTYAVNTCGAIVGAVLAGLVLMPLVGLKNVIVLGAAVDLALAVALLRPRRATAADASSVPVASAPESGAPESGASGVAARDGGAGRRFALAGVISAVVLAGAVFVIELDRRVLTSSVYRHGNSRLAEDRQLIFTADGRSASVAVTEDTTATRRRRIHTNGKVDATVSMNRRPDGPGSLPQLADDEPTQLLLGLAPLLLRPEATAAAVIGFGSGVTCDALLGSPVLRRVDVIEIEPQMVAGAELCRPVNERAFIDGRLELWIDDARSYFSSRVERYDVIISEPSNPWVSGVASLFSVEFYREVPRYLSPGGVFVQWLQGYEIDDELMLNVLAAMDSVFADYLVLDMGAGDWIILAVAEGETGSFDGRPLAWDGTREHFELLGIHDVAQADGLIAANRRLLHPFVSRQQPNTDEHPILDTRAERARFMQRTARFLHWLRNLPGPVVEVLGGVARRPYPLAGIGDDRPPFGLGLSERAAAQMRAALRPDPDDPRVQPVTEWHAATEALRAAAPPADGQWGPWLSATVAVYGEVAPYLPVHEQRWWREVMQLAAHPSAPQPVRAAVDLLDALDRRDGPRLRERVNGALAGEPIPLPGPVLAIAGAVALELEQAPAPRRRAFAQRIPDRAPGADASADTAYQVFRAYLMRP